MKSVDEVIRDLPPDLQRQVLEFAEFLKRKRASGEQMKLRLSWAGALSEYREQYTSLSLQKKAQEWWCD